MAQREAFFDLYKQYTQGQESPESFHFWTAVGLVASVAGRSIWTDRGYYNLYPNHYIILVSKSALARKSTAFAKIGIPRVLEPTLKILDSNGLGGGGPTLIGHKMTPESLCQELVRREKNAATQTKMDTPVPIPAFYTHRSWVYSCRDRARQVGLRIY